MTISFYCYKNFKYGLVRVRILLWRVMKYPCFHWSSCTVVALEELSQLFAHGSLWYFDGTYYSEQRWHRMKKRHGPCPKWHTSWALTSSGLTMAGVTAQEHGGRLRGFRVLHLRRPSVCPTHLGYFAVVSQTLCEHEQNLKLSSLYMHTYSFNSPGSVLLLSFSSKEGQM